MLCYFRNMDASTKVKLLYSFCSSLYGAELWDLSILKVLKLRGVKLRSKFGVLWRTHSNIVHSLFDNWPEQLIMRNYA